MKKRYTVRHADEVAPVACPCGASQRILTASDSTAASVHVVTIKADSQAHYHKKTSEYYFVLSGEGEMHLEGDVIPVRAGHAISIPPGVRHCARGNLKVVNLVVPPFDPSDEFVV
jgi:mannose-6-phosphate isomerase-like protein (cupin superfamily)